MTSLNSENVMFKRVFGCYIKNIFLTFESTLTNIDQLKSARAKQRFLGSKKSEKDFWIL